MGALLECDCGGEIGGRSQKYLAVALESVTSNSVFHDRKLSSVRARRGMDSGLMKTCRSGLSSIVHDEVFMFRKDEREIEVKRSRCGEDGR